MNKIIPAFIALLFIGCTSQRRITTHIALPGYQLVFHDEFNKNKLDTAIWGFHNLGKRRSAVNIKEACRVNKNGELEIRNWTEINGKDTVHHAGMVETKKNFAYGYYEARIKFDVEPGSWGAFWIMYHNFQRAFTADDRPGETGVEMDIIEYLATKNGHVVHNLHWNGYGEFHKTLGSGELKHGQLSGYHIYSLLWTPEEYTFYIDGEKTWSTKDGISHVPEYVILSTEIEDKGWAGNIPKGGYGSFDITKNKMFVDYIRVFQKKADTK
ncbi:MAG TPA: glycoside hydrolase family 16 protein [Niabella sp.]|nr:glycoside hydrolase family 16 protein [Niabella sp.]